MGAPDQASLFLLRATGSIDVLGTQRLDPRGKLIPPPKRGNCRAVLSTDGRHLFWFNAGSIRPSDNPRAGTTIAVFDVRSQA